MLRTYVKNIIPVIDAPRNDIYENTLGESKSIWMNRLLEEKCRQYGLYFIDLTDLFRELYAADGVKFQSEYDAHWNEHGHMAAAEVLFKRIIEIAE